MFTRENLEVTETYTPEGMHVVTTEQTFKANSTPTTAIGGPVTSYTKASVATPKLKIPQPKVLFDPKTDDDFLFGCGSNAQAAASQLKEETELLTTMVYVHLYSYYVTSLGDREKYAAATEAFKKKVLVRDTYLDAEGNERSNYYSQTEQLENLEALFHKWALSKEYYANLKHQAINRNKTRNQQRLLANGQMNEDKRGLEKRPGYANLADFTLNQLEETEAQVEKAIANYEELDRSWSSSEILHYHRLKARLADVQLRIVELEPSVQQSPSELAVALYAP